MLLGSKTVFCGDILGFSHCHSTVFKNGDYIWQASQPSLIGCLESCDKVCERSDLRQTYEIGADQNTSSSPQFREGRVNCALFDQCARN